jgi:hypothetical protein
MVGPEFEWTPSTVTTPVRAFVRGPTTLAHYVWTGSGFADRTATGTTFTATGGAGQGGAIGLVTPADRYATFANGMSWVASGSLPDTSGDFTVCVRFKPGAHPGTATKTLVARGATATEGWSLVQTGQSYAFRYHAPGEAESSSNPWPADPNDGSDPTATVSSPELWAVDYLCGGRNGSEVVGVAHGMTAGYAVDPGATLLTDDASLPLVIGADADGADGAGDAGVYEVIIDERPATLAVMKEIVAVAEGRPLANAFGGAATWVPDFASSARVLGVDANPYVLPPYLTVPYLRDAGGLLVGGQDVLYAQPLTEDSTVTGFCIAAELRADAAWWSGGPVVEADFLQLGNAAYPPGFATMFIRAGTGTFGFSYNVALGGAGETVEYLATPQTGWTPGSAHTFMACVDPVGPPPVNMNLYLDGSTTALATHAMTEMPFSLADPSVAFGIGNMIPTGAWAPIHGARVQRAFICPSADPALCR